MKWTRGVKFIFSLIIFLTLSNFILLKPVFATSFDLLGPTETLVRGQDVRFTINVDTQNQSLTSTQVGMTYDSQYLQYLNAIPGDTFTTITANKIEEGKLVITGMSQSGYSGSGTFAYVSFKLIAQAPGSTEICALFVPTPTAPPQNPTTNPTSAPTPTSLPRSGESKPVYIASLLGAVFMLSTLGIFMVGKTRSFPRRKKAR